MTEDNPTEPLPILTFRELTKRENIPARNYRSDRPIQIDDTPVRVRAEALHPVWWRGKQWAVTEHGIECLDGSYSIPKGRLIEQFETWSWLRQMGTKDWVDTEEFATAWLVALTQHGVRVSGSAVRKAVADGIVREIPRSSIR